MPKRTTRSQGVATKDSQDANTQRAKKRAWDRAAQRKRREKTKTQLDHLEQTIRVLSSDDQAGRVTKLLAEIEKLRTENERLRRIMADSAKLLQSAQSGHDKGGISNAQDVDVSNTGVSEGEGSVRAAQSTACASPGSEEPVTATTEPAPLVDDVFGVITGSEGLAITTTKSSHLCDDFFGAFDLSMARSPSSCNTPRTTRQQYHAPLVGFPTSHFSTRAAAFTGPAENHANLDYFMPNMPSSRAAWQMANRIFDTIYHVDILDALASDLVDAGALLKGIDLGWDACRRAIERSPTIHILSQMDKCLWSKLPKSSRAAIAYKSYMLLRYLLNPSHRNLLNMPEWARPTTLQRNTDHPVAISFFPWPALRERLILNQEYYLNMSNFFVRVVSEFEFRWPYSYEHTFFVEGHTGEYWATPLFTEHVRNLRNWTMKERFFDSFPELRSDVYLLGTAMHYEIPTVS